MSVRLTKMHGLGNDYLFLDGRSRECRAPEALAREVSDRHLAIGSDGLILVLNAQGDADARMRMFNADGSESEMCGNGLRCFAKYVVDRGISTAQPLAVETAAGVLNVAWTRGSDGLVSEVEVEMGVPTLACEAIPAVLPGVDPMAHVITHAIDRAAFDLPLSIEPTISLVSMGNPHVIVYGSDRASIDLCSIGPQIECNRAFPNRINVHVVFVHTPTHVSMITWERGSGITQACGTGACAVVVAGVLGGRHERSVRVTLPGGDLAVSWLHNADTVRMKGPAEEVFDVEWER